MRITILDDRTRLVILPALGMGVLACLPLLVVPALGDPYQAPRALAVALALVPVLLALRHAGTIGAPARLAGWTMIALAVLVGVAAVVNHPASSLWGVHGRFQGLASMALLGLSGVAGWQLQRRSVPTFARVLCVVLLAQGLVVVFQALGGGVPDGTFGNRAIAASWLAVSASVSAATAMASSGKSRWLAMSAASVGAVALGVTGTRGAWIGLAAGLAVTAALAASPRTRRTALAAAGLGVALIAIGALAGGTESSGKLSPAALSSGSARSRLEIWRGTASMIADRPLLGVGPGRFIYEFPAYEPLAHAKAEGPGIRADNAHDAALQLAAESGVPAGLAYLLLAGIAVTAGIRGARARDGVALVATAGLAAYLGQGLFGVPAIETDALGWMLGGIALASAPATGASTRTRYPLGLASAGAAVLIAVAASVYLVGNASYARGLGLFSVGRFDEAAKATGRAVDADPLTDTYRVAHADTGLYRDAAAASAALEVVADGLRLEPRSFDLALARARLLKASAATPNEVADAYVDAVDCYPLDVVARREAIGALDDAGRRPAAITMARDMLELVPNDPVALEMVK